MHEYTPEQALDLLLVKLAERDEALASEVRGAIDVGKEELIEEREGRGVARHYRSISRYSHEEALNVALNALQAYFVELPMYISSSDNDLQSCNIAVTRQAELDFGQSASRDGDYAVVPVTNNLRLAFEVRTQTQLSDSDEEEYFPERFNEAMIDEQTQNIEQLKGLLNFKDDNNG